MSDGSCRFSVKQERAGLISSPMIGDLNSITNTTHSACFGFTSSPTLNNRDYQYNHVITTRAWNEVAQLLLPINMVRRLAFRTVGYENNKFSPKGGFRELAYTDETPLLQDNGNNTKKIVVDRVEGTADSSVSQDYIQDLGIFTNKTAGELKQAILDAISTFNSKACIYIRFGGNVVKACQNWANDSYVIEPGGTLNTICIRNIYDRGRWAFIEIFSYGYDKYVTFLSNGKWMPMKKVSLVDV